MSITAAKNSKTYSAAFGKVIIAIYGSFAYVYISCTCLSSRLELNSRFVGPGVWGVRGRAPNNNNNNNNIY